MALQVLGCRDYLGPPILDEAMAEGDELLGYRRCKLVGELCCQFKGAMGGGQGMAQHQNDEKQIDWIYSKILQPQELQPPVVPKEVQSEPELIQMGNGDSHDDKGWKHQDSSSHSACRRTGQRQIWFSALIADMGLVAVPSEMSELAKPEPCSSTTY